MSPIAENLGRVEDAVATACRKAGRSRADVRLMAVSKTHPVELLLEAAAAGHRLFGENRVQEFSEKARVLAGSPFGLVLDASDPADSPDSQHSTDQPAITPFSGTASGTVSPTAPIPAHTGAPHGTAPVTTDRLAIHLIGHLQSNKATRAVEVFSSIDTIDSLKLAERLFEAARRQRRRLPILLEIKLSDEESKEGLAPNAPELTQLLDRLPDLAGHLPLRGLMTVAPISTDPAVAETCFRQLAALRNQLAQTHPLLSFEELSMGMSGDFEAAITAGSTTIRIGTAIFGARPKPAPREPGTNAGVSA